LAKGKSSSMIRLMISLKEEKKLWEKGYKRVVGLDEAGRGPLAGPVVAAAITIKNPKSEILNPKQNPKSQIPNSKLLEYWKIRISDLFRISNLGFRILKLRDSKKITPKQREKFYKLITNNPNIEWGIGKVSEKVIDKINILEATKLAMKKAIENLNSKLKSQNSKVDFLITDGNFKLDLPIPQKSIIKADEKVFSCALASIIAKVWRDRIMKRYHQKYPQYGFGQHKGYPTKEHYKKIKKYGPCKIHRKSFKLNEVF